MYTHRINLHFLLFVGKDVTKYKKGDRVVVNPTVSAREKEENVDLYDGYTFIGLGSDTVAFFIFCNVFPHFFNDT
jgi:hypothetical protein